MAIRHRGRFALAAIAVILLGIFVPPLVNISRYRGRIATSIGNAIGRRTTIGSVSLRLLPQPGFDLGNVTVEDDPAFGAEPMLHADAVTANLRLTSLWRGHLEIAKLSLQYPSLNLVRAQDGRWNVETLLEHASRIPTAPTSKTRPESRPRFPYIEADSGRINFKIGQEKKVYSLADADFSLWLASETEVRTHLAARMVRTDSYLSDTGTLKLDGRFQRAWNLRETPLAVTASLDNAQLGQLTKLVDGLDSGWRGGVALNVVLNGTPSNLKISAQASIDDFRRYDITSTDHVRLNAHCAANFSSRSEQLSDINCQSPTSAGGVISLRGNLDGLTNSRAYDLNLALAKVPVQQIIFLARHAKKGVPDDLGATGDFNGSFSFRKPDQTSSAVWLGDGTTSDLVLRSSVLTPQLSLKPLQFALQSSLPPRPADHARNRSSVQVRPPDKSKQPSHYRLVVLPFQIPAGAATPVTMSGWFGLDDYNFSLTGDSDIPRLLQIAQVAGIRAPQLNADGSAKLDLSVAGKWAGLESPKPIGAIQVRVKVRMKGVAAPLQVASANLALGDDALTATNIAASFTDTHVALAGMVRMPRQCDSIPACPIQFDLRSDQLSTDDLNRLLNPRVARRPWYAILGRGPEPSIFGTLNATGHLAIARLTIKALPASHVAADVHLEAGKLAFSNIQADIWGGKHHGEWTADFTHDQPVYSGSGTLDAVAMPALLSLVKDTWGTGTIRANYSASATGFTESDLFASAAANIGFDWQKGTLRYLSFNGSNAPLSFTRFAGTLNFHDGKLVLTPESKMTASSGIYQVSGTASGRQIDLTFRNGKHGYSVTGTVSRPKVAVTTVSETQALLQDKRARE